MILNRLGNKRKLAVEIQKYFPPHKVYIEPFFGAGGMFFNKPRAAYNIVNDLDSDVFNLFQVVSTRLEELREAVDRMPVHADLLRHWKVNQEADPLMKALRFIFLSNFTYLGKPNNLAYGTVNYRRTFQSRLDATFEALLDVQFTNHDFRELFRLIPARAMEQAFVYCDPPYLDTDDNYEAGFQESDSADLFTALQATGAPWAMSEFDHSFILAQAELHGLRVITLGERQNLKNRRTEVLVTNYQVPQLSLF